MQHLQTYTVGFRERISNTEWVQRSENVKAANAHQAKQAVIKLFSCRIIEVYSVNVKPTGARNV